MYIVTLAEACYWKSMKDTLSRVDHMQTCIEPESVEAPPKNLWTQLAPKTSNLHHLQCAVVNYKSRTLLNANNIWNVVQITRKEDGPPFTIVGTRSCFNF